MKCLKLLLWVVLISGALFAVAGCFSDDTGGTTAINAPVEQANPGSVYDTDAQSRMNFITAHLQTYTEHAKNLPAATEYLQRAALGNIFDDLSDLLPKLAGPNPSAIFRQALHIVQGTKQQLNGLALDASSDTVVESGLRGASDALEDLSTSFFADQTDLATAINSLNTKLDELDTSPPDTHRQVTADAVNMIGQIMHTMDTVLTERLQPAAMPTTAPTTAPSVATPAMESPSPAAPPTPPSTNPS
jgi:hypothetical protein